MVSPVEAIQTEVNRLEEQAVEIEEEYDQFFDEIGYQIDPDSDEIVWNLPTGKIETLQREILFKYETWYNDARFLINKYLSDRASEFERNYVLFRAFVELKQTRYDSLQVMSHEVDSIFDRQRHKVRSIPSRIRVEELEIRKQISVDIAQGELTKAKSLFEDGEIRASGVIAGIALERYLLMLCQNSDSDIEYKYNDGISALAQKLFEADEIGSTPQKHLQHLADIRADCAHANEEEPDESDVRRLLEDAEDYIRGRKI
ncbi:SRPBCC family protein [Haloferax volcanii]|uniref:hypothetical protein n=1 Tax=Haloferax volcanii TaxID=2246 RepID=UPI00385DF769